MASGECSIASIVLLLRKIEEEIHCYCRDKGKEFIPYCKDIIEIIECKIRVLENYGFEALESRGL